MFFKLFPLGTILVTFCLTTTAFELIPSHLKNDFGDALEAIFTMGIKLESLMNTNSTIPRNFMVSPLSLTLLLGQLMLGAEGKFRDHLYELISLSPDTRGLTKDELYSNFHIQLGRLLDKFEKTENQHYILNSNTALFVDERVKLKGEFIYKSKMAYKTEITRLNFRKPTETTKINEWALNHTNGLIKTVLDGPLTSDMAAIFANVIYFNGKWEQPFSSELNHVGVFKSGKELRSEVTYMVNLLEQVPYVESKRLNCKMLVLPYLNRELGMYIVLPNEGHLHEYEISKFTDNLKTADYLEMLANLRDHDVTVKVPKFSLTSSLSLLKPLQIYATYKKFMDGRPTLRTKINTGNQVKNVLDDLDDRKAMFVMFRSNFNSVNSTSHIGDVILEGASINGDLKVSDVLQQMSFSLNEVGTEVAVVSAGITDYIRTKTFNANKPFIFFIRHEATAATLFWGTISNPAST